MNAPQFEVKAAAADSIVALLESIESLPTRPNPEWTLQQIRDTLARAGLLRSAE